MSVSGSEDVDLDSIIAGGQFDQSSSTDQGINKLEVVQLLGQDFNCLFLVTDWYSQLDRQGGNQQEADLAFEPPGVKLMQLLLACHKRCCMLLQYLKLCSCIFLAAVFQEGSEAIADDDPDASYPDRPHRRQDLLCMPFTTSTIKSLASCLLTQDHVHACWKC